jgi:hypothetical protein
MRGRLLEWTGDAPDGDGLAFLVVPAPDVAHDEAVDV